MRRQLHADLSRIERLAEDAQRRAAWIDPVRLEAILDEGRQQATRGDPPRRTPEESLARGREFRAILAAQRNSG
jgi:hypothetical protein